MLNAKSEKNETLYNIYYLNKYYKYYIKMSFMANIHIC